MPTYCDEDDPKAIIELSKNGVSFTIESDNPPITITCIDNNFADCVLVDVLIEYTYYQPTNGQSVTNTSTQRCFTPVLGVRIAEPTKKSVQIRCKGNQSNGNNSCGNLNWYGSSFGIGSTNDNYITNTRILNISPTNTPSQGGKGVKITDKDGRVIFSDPNIDCSWSVRCGNCPPGTEEHSIPEYPGYCCFNCEEIKAEIQSLTAQVRAKNG